LASISTPTSTAKWRLYVKRATSAHCFVNTVLGQSTMMQIRNQPLLCRYLLVIRDTRSGAVRHLLAQHIIVCHGILGRQYLPEVCFCTVLLRPLAWSGAEQLLACRSAAWSSARASEAPSL
jgi:hypothetical protein